MFRVVEQERKECRRLILQVLKNEALVFAQTFPVWGEGSNATPTNATKYSEAVELRDNRTKWSGMSAVVLLCLVLTRRTADGDRARVRQRNEQIDNFSFLLKWNATNTNN